MKPDVNGLGKPSDHSVPVAVPYTDTSKPRKKEFQWKVTQPIPESKLITLGQWITCEEFEDVNKAMNPDDKVKALSKIMNDKINNLCPKKTVKIYKNDQEWMTESVRKLRRKKSREYRRHGKSKKFVEMNAEFEDIKGMNTKKYMEEEIETLKKFNLSQFYRKLKVMGSRLNENEPQTFTLPEFFNEDIPPLEAAERIACHFSSISKEYPPLDVNSLPPRVRDKIQAEDVMKNAPKIEAFEVYEKFQKRKNKVTSVPGDIPSKVKNEFGPELASPVADIFNSINGRLNM